MWDDERGNEIWHILLDMAIGQKPDFTAADGEALAGYLETQEEEIAKLRDSLDYIARLENNLIDGFWAQCN